MATQGFEIAIDDKLLKRTALGAGRAYRAMADTIQGTGVGEVINSKRNKIPSERANKRKGRAATRTPHGREIAFFLRAKGKDPYKYDQKILKETFDFMADESTENLNRAFVTGRPQKNAMKRVVRAAAEHLKDWVVENLRSGGLGQKKITGSRDAFYKSLRSKIARGVATARYGFPPPYGILSGRFIEGIRTRWKNRRVL